MNDLQKIPGVGPKMAADLLLLGINRIEDLRDKDPEELYERLCRMTGHKQDPCVLYVFRCAVYYATEKNPEPDKLKWWNWKTEAEPVLPHQKKGDDGNPKRDEIRIQYPFRRRRILCVKWFFCVIL